MAKTFFTNVTPGAVEGIRKMYAADKRAHVSTIYNPKTKDYTVVVVIDEKERVAA